MVDPTCCAIENVVVVGASSGKWVTMSLLLKLKQEPSALPAAAVLLCPWLDLAEVGLCTNAYLAGIRSVIPMSSHSRRI
jgi:acetyl esterase/lipase